MATSQDLGDSRLASYLRAWGVAYLFNGLEAVFAANQPPATGLVDLFGRLSDLLQQAAISDFSRLGSGVSPIEVTVKSNQAQLEHTTGEHYGRLFVEFSAATYVTEARELLRLRLERNGLDISPLPDSTVLDASCGGGRYSAAWA